MKGRQCRTGKVVGVLLAAGFSYRFRGLDKRTFRLTDGRILACATASNLIRAIPNSCAVIRPEDRILGARLRRLGLRLILNRDADRGLSSSVHAAVRAWPKASGWIFLPADMPLLTTATIRTVHRVLAGGANGVRPSYRGTLSNPVGFDKRFREALLGLCGDVGARNLVINWPAAGYRIGTCDAGVGFDIDRLCSPLLLSPGSPGSKPRFSDADRIPADACARVLS